MTGSRELEELEPVTRPATAAIIADRLRQAIIEGPFRAGDQLAEAHLAEALGVSRGPVREALQRLIQEGLLRSEPNRGVFVEALDQDEVLDIYFARTVVERAAVDRVVERGDASAFDELQECVDQMRAAAGRQDAMAVARWDLAFHTALTRAGGSKRLTRMFDTLVTETRMALMAGRRELRADDAVIEEHASLLEALRAADQERAHLILDRHMETGIKRRLRDLPPPER